MGLGRGAEPTSDATFASTGDALLDALLSEDSNASFHSLTADGGRGQEPAPVAFPEQPGVTVAEVMSLQTAARRPYLVLLQFGLSYVWV